MGLLDGLKNKKDKSAAPKKVKEKVAVKANKKEKKPLFGGKKKELTLIERMQLEESVAAASLDVVQDLADNGGSAVREIESGLLIVAFTNESLEAAGLDPSSEEFGSFAEALRSETVESIALADDLANGIIGVIPSEETLLSLDEFDFVQELPFNWAIVSFDLDDSDQLTILEDTVYIARLVELANDSSIKVVVENGAVITVTDDDSFDDEPQGATEDFPEDDAFPDDDELPEDEFPDDTDFPEDNEMDLDDGMPPVEEYDEPEVTNIYDAPEDELDADNVFDFDEPELEDDASYAVDEELMPVAESKEAINRIVNHGFNNPELGLSIEMKKFDDYFDAVTIAQFDTDRTDDSELQNVISKLRQDANTELSRFHQDNILSLRNKFTTSMRDIHNKLTESLDHLDEGTTYGERYYQIEAAFNDAMRDLDRRVAGEAAVVNQQYQADREEYGENAKREAYAVYDSRHKPELDRKITAIRENVPAEIKIARDVEIGELYADRRTVAQRLFDKAMTSLLQTLQAEHHNIAQKELNMYDTFRKNMDAYLRRHFADEVLRAKAEAEKLRQSHEAERVRQEYEQMLITKTRQIEEADQQARDAVNQLEAAHREQLNEVKADYDKRVQREQQDNMNLREQLNRANDNIGKIGEQKEKEVSHQMKVLEDRIKAQDKELEYAKAQTSRSQKPNFMIMGAVAAIFLAFGIMAGFLQGAGTTEVAPASPPPQGEQAAAENVSYNAAPSVEAFETLVTTEYDHQDAA